VIGGENKKIKKTKENGKKPKRIQSPASDQHSNVTPKENEKAGGRSQNRKGEGAGKKRERKVRRGGSVLDKSGLSKWWGKGNTWATFFGGKG